MSASPLRTELLAIRATIDRLIDEAEKPVEKTPPAPAPRYLSVPMFAKHRGVSESTVRKWIREGMPVTIHAPIRVMVALADAWLDGQNERSRLRLVGNDNNTKE